MVTAFHVCVYVCVLLVTKKDQNNLNRCNLLINCCGLVWFAVVWCGLLPLAISFLPLILVLVVRLRLAGWVWNIWQRINKLFSQLSLQQLAIGEQKWKG